MSKKIVQSNPENSTILKNQTKKNSATKQKADIKSEVLAEPAKKWFMNMASSAILESLKKKLKKEKVPAQDVELEYDTIFQELDGSERASLQSARYESRGWGQQQSFWDMLFDREFMPRSVGEQSGLQAG